MKILTVTTLFPHVNNPKHGVFIETRLRQLRRQYPDVEIKVIAPIPYFPFKHPLFGDYAQYANAPDCEVRFGMEVYHPRYFVVPKIGMTLTPQTLAHTVLRQAKRLLAEGFNFDLIDGHYFYPDGVAIAKVAKKLNKPFTVTARGTDINLIPEFTKPRRQIQQVFKQANHTMAVCEALRQSMINLGAEPTHVSTLRNGVDLNLFAFQDEHQQMLLRQKLALPEHSPVIISTGHLIERKGHHLVIDAVQSLTDVTLLIAGSGPDGKTLERQVHKAGMTERVRFLGSLSQTELAEYYGAADLSVLASSREGWANVLLESMSCGTPVVATNIWGTPEVVQTPEAGRLVKRTANDLRQGIIDLLDTLPVRSQTRAYAEQFTWQSTSEAQYRIFNAIVNHQPIPVLTAETVQ